MTEIVDTPQGQKVAPFVPRPRPPVLSADWRLVPHDEELNLIAYLRQMVRADRDPAYRERFDRIDLLLAEVDHAWRGFETGELDYKGDPVLYELARLINAWIQSRSKLNCRPDGDAQEARDAIQ